MECKKQIVFDMNLLSGQAFLKPGCQKMVRERYINKKN